MGMFEKIVDLKDTFEGKLLAVFMAFVLVLGMTNVYAFAANEGTTKEDAKVVFDIAAGAHVSVSSGGEYQPIQGNTVNLPYVDVNPGGSIAFKVELEEGYEIPTDGIKATSDGLKLGNPAFVQTDTNLFTLSNVATKITVTVDTVELVAAKTEAATEAIVEQEQELVQQATEAQQSQRVAGLLGNGPTASSNLSFETTPPKGATVDSDGKIKLLTGDNSFSIGYVITASNVEGAILAIPMSDGMTIHVGEGITSSIETITAGNDFSNGALPSGKYFVLKFSMVADETVKSTYVSIGYLFKEGVTPAGIVQATGQLLEGVSQGGTIVGKAGAQPINPPTIYTIVSDTNEKISVSNKALVTPSFAGRASYDYAKATTDPGKDPAAREQQEITYNVTMSSTGNDNGVTTVGREYQEKVTIKDQISGLLAKPNKVTVNGVEVNGTWDNTAKTYSFEFDANNSADKPLQNQTFTVTVNVDKYTYMTDSQSDPMSTINNKAWSVNKPIDKISKNTVTQATATTANSFNFGFYKGSRSEKNLTIQKMIRTAPGATPIKYDSTQQAIYGKDVNGTSYAGAKFTLEKKNGTSSYVSIGLDYSNAAISPSGTVTFSNLEGSEEGVVYRLTEVSDVSPYFNTAAQSYFMVKEVGGVLKIYSTDSGGGNQKEITSNFEVVNDYKCTGSITFTVKKDVVLVEPDARDRVAGRNVNVYVYDTVAKDYILYKKGKTDDNGRFKFDADPNSKYKIEAVDDISGYATPAPKTDITTATLSPELVYTCTSGSFTLSKTFKGADGSTIEPDYNISYSVYEFGSVTNGVPNPGAEAVYSGTISKSGNKTNSGDPIQKLFIPGKYVVVETGITSVSTGKDQYKAGAYAEVTLEAAKTTSYVNVSLTNESTYGQVTITNSDTIYNNNLISTEGFKYIFTSTTDSSVVKTFEYKDLVNGKATLPAGTYAVTSTCPSAYYFKSVTPETITIEKGKATAKVDYVHAKKPTYTISKQAYGADGAKTGLKDAKFTLYKLDTKDGSATKGQYVNQNITKTSDANGLVSFDSLEAGTYVLVESTVPGGYLAPAYRANFYNGATLKSPLSTSDVAGAPTFVVAADANGDDGQAKASGVEAVNTPNPTLTVKKTNGSSGIVGSAFTLYASDKTTVVGTVSPGTAGSPFKDISLKEGTYYVKETTVPPGYVGSTSEIKVVVDKYGMITLSSAGKDVSITDGDGKSAKGTITVANYVKPQLNFKKMGQTNSFDSNGNRKKVALSDAEFTLVDKDNNPVKFTYVEATATYTISAAGTVGTIKTNANGLFNIAGFDPSAAPYKISEVDQPASATAAGLTYSLIKDAEIKVEAIITDGKVAGYTAKIDHWAASNDTSPITLSNNVRTYQIELEKVKIIKNGPDKGTPAGTQDGFNGKFDVYKMEDCEEINGKLVPKAGKEPVDTMTSGSSDPDKLNMALSKWLPEGFYVIFEQAGTTYGSDGKVWNFNETTGKYEETDKTYIVIELKENGKAQQKVTFANGAVGTGGGDPIVWMRAYATKFGVKLEANGTETEKELLNGIDFDIFAAYVNADGNPVIIGDVLETVTSGSMSKIKDDDNSAGSFMTRYYSSAEIKAILTAAGISTDVEIGLMLVEKTTNKLPSGYSQDQLGQKTFVPCDMTKASDSSLVFQTNGKDNAQLSIPSDAKEIKNYRGLANLKVTKTSSAGASAMSGLTAKFNLYRVGNDTDVVKEVNISGTTAVTLTNLPAGYYYLKEVTAPASHLTKGTWKLGSATAASFSNGYIGPIALSGSETSAATIDLTITDYKKAQLTLSNLGDGGTAVVPQSSYEITYSNKVDDQVVGSASDIESTYFTNGAATLTDITSVTLTGLADGTYTIKETAVAQTHLINNLAKASPFITVKIKDGIVTSVTTATTTGTTASDKVTSVVNTAAGQVKVDHASMGKLAIKMGYLDQNGTQKALLGLTDPASTTFKITKNDGSAITSHGGTLAQIGTTNEYTWTTDGQFLYLDEGTYKVTQTRTSATGFILDNKETTVAVGATGTAYVMNNTETDFYKSGSNTFYNKINRGQFTIYKLGQDDKALSSTSQNGAQFELYNAAGTQKIEDVYNEAGTTKLTNGIIQISGNQATFSVAEGNYLLKEVKASADKYDVRAAGILIEVKGNIAKGKIEHYFNTDQPCTNNTIGLVDALKTNVTAKKTTKYNQDGSNSSSVQTVGGVYFDLYKEYEPGKYKLYETQMTNVLRRDADHGLTPEFTLGEGTYKFIERDNTSDDYDLSWVNFTDSDYGSIEKSKEFTVSYNATKGKLELNTGTNADWNDTVLTVDNPYQGALFTIEKVDFVTGNPIPNKEFSFELYLGYPDENNKPLRTIDAEETSGAGILSFAPIAGSIVTDAIANKQKFYILETGAASGYSYDEAYGGPVTEVVLKELVAGSNVYQTTIKNKLLEESNIGLEKKVNGSKETSFSKALVEAGNSATYTITQNQPGNDLKIKNYTFTEKGMSFYEQGATSPVPAAYAPKYTIKNISVGVSTSNKTVKASDTAVFSRVTGVLADGSKRVLSEGLSGSGWTDQNIVLSGTALDDVKSFYVEYSDVDPQDGTPQVGFAFKPANITVQVDFAQYVQEKNSDGKYFKDITKIENKASVKADKYSEALDSAKITLPTYEDKRPSMSIKKEIVGGENDGSDQFKPAQSYEYEVTLKNTSAVGSELNITDPMILDVLPNDAMTITGYEVVSSGLTPTVTTSATHALYAFKTELAPQQSITVKIKVKMNAIVKTNASGNVVNTAYGTSAAPLSFSDTYKTGASFVAEKGVASVDGDAAEALNIAYMNGHNRGMYVKDDASSMLLRSGYVQVLRSISTQKNIDGDKVWVSDADKVQEVIEGDTIFYRMQTSNDQSQTISLSNVAITENMAYNGDEAGTSLTDSFFGKATFNYTSISVSTNSGPVASNKYKIKYYDGLNGTGSEVSEGSAFRSFVVVMDSSFELVPGDLLAVEYSMKLPTDAQLSEADYAENVEMYVNTISKHTHNFASDTASTVKSNMVRAQFIAPTEIKGSIWNDTDRNGVMDGAEVLFTDAVKVTLYKGATDVELDSVTTTDGTYTFNGKTSDGVTYDLRALYQKPDGPSYTVVFSNPDSSALQFTQYTAFENYIDMSPQKTYSHVKTVASSNVDGSTGALGVYAKKAANVVNAGLCAKPKVYYQPNDSEASRVNAGTMPLNNPESAVSGKTYKVSSQVPTRPGYDFVKWEVVEGLPKTTPATTFVGGNTFEMPYKDVELKAIWAANFTGLGVTGYNDVYDAAYHGITITGTDKLLVGDTLNFYTTNADDAISRTGVIKAIDPVTKAITVTYDGKDISLEEFLNAFINVHVKAGAVADYDVTLYVTRDDVRKEVGSTKVRITPVEIVVNTNTKSKVYDAKALTDGGNVVVSNGTAPGTTQIGYATAAASGTTVTLVNNGTKSETAQFYTTGTRTDVGWVTNGYTYDLGSLIATNYKVTDGTIGKLTVTKVKLTITTGSDSKVYDTTALTKGGSVNIDKGITPTTDVAFGYSNSTEPTDWKAVQLTSTETIYLRTTGSQTNVDSSSNTYAIDWGTANSDNYDLVVEFLGTLEVTPIKLIVTTGSDSKVYDTTALTKGGSVNIDKGTTPTTDVAFGYSNSADPTEWTPVTLATGETVYFRTTGTVTDVDTKTNTYAIDWATNSVDKKNYKIVTENLGTLKVTPAQLYIKTDSASKYYDNTPLTADGTIAISSTGAKVPFVYNDGVITLENGETISLATIGTITEPGSTSNDYSLVWDGTAKAKNYAIAGEEIGTLVITNNPEEIVVITTGGTWTYDGLAHDAVVEDILLPTGYLLAEASTEATVTNVASGTIAATADNVVITTSADTIVYDRAANTNAGLTVTYFDSSLLINPAPLNVVTQDATKQYDGQPLTAQGSLTGLVNNENASFKVTGSQTEVGSSANSYSLVFDGTAVKSNYTVSESVGTLRVSSVPTGPIGAIVTPISSFLGGIVQSATGTGNPSGDGIAISDGMTPLGNRTGCWVHYYIIMGIVITAIYSVAVLLRRRKFISDLNGYEDTVINGNLEGESESAEQAQPSLDGHQPAGN